MALITCKECSTQISTQAKRCPACGAKAPRKPIPKWAVITNLILWPFIILTCSLMPKQHLTPEEELQDAARRAAYQCEYYIKQALNDPGSAEFDESNIRIATEIKGSNGSGRWAITVPLRAKNRFNAMVYGV